MYNMVEIGQVQNRTFFVPYMITVERGLDPAEDGPGKAGRGYWERGYWEHELLGMQQKKEQVFCVK